MSHSIEAQPQVSGPNLLPPEIKARLLENGRKNAERINDDSYTIDFHPVVKLFTPDAGFTWLLTEIDPDHHEIAFGLCDLGMGYPELGCVSLAEIADLRGKLGLPVERDLHFEGEKSLSAYADEARLLGRIKTYARRDIDSPHPPREYANMTTEFQHTATPWVAIHRETVGEWWIGSRNTDPALKLPIAQMTCAIKAMSGNSVQEAAANAAFIVRACNAHTALVQALENIVAFFDSYVTTLPDRNGKDMLNIDFSLDDARAALDLARAQGE
jgi:hypothetical protein